jgi:hypothetical protein
MMNIKILVAAAFGWLLLFNNLEHASADPGLTVQITYEEIADLARPYIEGKELAALTREKTDAAIREAGHGVGEFKVGEDFHLSKEGVGRSGNLLRIPVRGHVFVDPHSGETDAFFSFNIDVSLDWKDGVLTPSAHTTLEELKVDKEKFLGIDLSDKIAKGLARAISTSVGQDLNVKINEKIRAALAANQLAGLPLVADVKLLVDKIELTIGRPTTGQPASPVADGAVTIFEDADYKGRHERFVVGTYFPDLKKIGWNDKISSVQIEGDCQVILWEHSEAEKHGEFVVLPSSNPKLDSVKFNDRASSLKVEPKPAPPPPGVPHVPGSVTVYWDADFKGKSWTITEGTYIPDLKPHGWNDKISSFEIHGDSKIILWENSEKEGRGRSIPFDRDVRDLRPFGWNDRASALQVLPK